MRAIIEYLCRLSKPLVIVAGIILVSASEIIDYRYGTNISALTLAFMAAFLLCTLFALNRSLSREQELVTVDLLTGIANRKAFYDLAAHEISRMRRYKHPFTVAYIDIDNFKVVNYRFGHTAGDNLLHAAAQTVKASIRDVDVVARFADDEFIVLLPETNAEQSQIVLSRIRAKLIDVMERNEWPVTFSFGAVTFLHPPSSVEEVIKKAGSRMYAAKDSGPNVIDQEVFTT